MNILVTGGAGYIGSHVVKQLLESKQSYNITVLDNLSTGSEKTIETLKILGDFEFIKLDLCEFEKVETFIKIKNIDTIIHFAASIVVPESVENPLKYYMNNTVNTINLIRSAITCGVKYFVFSSTAAVYGEPVLSDMTQGVNEDFPAHPINPYGSSKLMSEKVLKDTAKAHETFKYAIIDISPCYIKIS